MKRALSAAGWMFFLAVIAAYSTAWGPAASAQGVLIIIDHPHPVPLPRPIPPWPHPRPTPPTPAISYKIKELSYQAKIKDQIAQVQVSQTFVNTGSQIAQVQFVFPLPYEGAIDRMTFMVDGKEYDAKLLEAKKAREIYEGYVRRNQDPALLEWVGTGMFQTSVFPVPPGAERKVTLKFSQLLRKDHQLTDFLLPLSTAKYTSSPVEKVSIEASIETTAEIKSVYSPTYPIEVKRPDSKHAIVKYEATNVVPATDFRLFFDTNDGKLGASLISYRPESSEEGFFLMLASPEIKADNADRPAKTVIIVADRSGSMSGKKIEQAKEAIKFVLNNLRKGDTFNIVAYDSAVESFKPELQKFDDETRKQALGFVEGLYAGGSTNIDGALTTALGMIKDDTRPNYVLFLTDGLPTAGETNEGKIVANAKNNNKIRTRMINFGVGYDVNSRLLDRLSRDNFGQSEYVRPNEDIEAHVSRLYSKMSSPMLTGVKVKIEVDAASVESGPAINRVYPKEVYDLFAGEQLVMVGRYKKPGEAKVAISGKIGGDEKKYDFPATLVEKSNDQTYAFVEKLWALRRVGEIIDEIDLKGKNDELVKELISLATKHGILTPYTSFLADDLARPGQLSDARENLEQTRRLVDRLGEAEGLSGVAQRAEKKSLQEAKTAGNTTRSYAMSPRGEAASGPAAPLVTGRPAAAKQDYAGGGAGAGFGNAAPQAGLAQNKFRDIDSDKEIAADAVQNVGSQTLYRRGKLWIAANAQTVDPEKDQAKIKKIKRFSDEYFALVKANTADENAVLATQQNDEQLLVTLRGQTYQIE
ncbi:von Willebrand factor type A domain protein [Anatilimnocola aggregata]|uniref:von Willebrand factor type A domain protein n=1 Tax=Anatilimnocola aggregata TaxID=2528021 RepID=A0A517Y4H0_9BACT|nr:VIT domain-containing protein [Anatilimnocola aggregata]QDU25143.1 von Willebrand factor type A domain protein [Anatilimnocola aggregata]